MANHKPINPGNSTGRAKHHEESPLLRESSDPLKAPASTEEYTIIPDELPTARLVIVLISTWMGLFLGALDSTIIATLSAPISTSFRSLSLLSWVASAYLIANAACQPISGRLTDIFSRRNGLIFSNLVFALGNLLCGLATNEAMMIAGRAVAGIGGGGLNAIAAYVTSDLVPLRKRGLIQGIGNVWYGVGAGLGGIFGGWVNDRFGWRWAFLAQVPFTIISAILVYFVVDIPPKQSSASKLSRVDFLGVFALVTTLVIFLLGLNSGGNIVPWTHPLVLTAFPLSLLSFVVFVYIETRIAAYPIIPVKLILNRTILASCLTHWFTTMSLFITMFYIPIFYQVAGYTTTAAGARLSLESAGTAVGSLVCGVIITKTGKYRILGLAIVGIFALGTGLLCTLTFDLPDWPAFVYLFLVGMGYGGMLNVALLGVISAVPYDQQAVVTSLTYAFRSTGSTMGIAIAGAVFNNILVPGLHERFDGYPGAADVINRLRESLDGLKDLPMGWRERVMDVYGQALLGVFIAATVLAVLAFSSVGFLKDHRLWERMDRRDSEE